MSSKNDDDKIIPFDPKRVRVPRTFEPFRTRQYMQVLPVWVDGEITLRNLLCGLQSVGLTIKSKGVEGFIIAKAE